eukprot:IDg17569t1
MLWIHLMPEAHFCVHAWHSALLAFHERRNMDSGATSVRIKLGSAGRDSGAGAQYATCQSSAHSSTTVIIAMDACMVRVAVRRGAMRRGAARCYAAQCGALCLTTGVDGGTGVAVLHRAVVVRHMPCRRANRRTDITVLAGGAALSAAMYLQIRFLLVCSFTSHWEAVSRELHCILYHTCPSSDTAWPETRAGAARQRPLRDASDVLPLNNPTLQVSNDPRKTHYNTVMNKATQNNSLNT